MLFCDAAAEGVGEGVEIMLDAVLGIGIATVIAGVVAIGDCVGCTGAEFALPFQRFL